MPKVFMSVRWLSGNVYQAVIDQQGTAYIKIGTYLA